MTKFTPPARWSLLLLAGLVACACAKSGGGPSQPVVLALQSGEDEDGDTRRIFWQVTGPMLEYSAVSANAADSTVMLKLEVDEAGTWGDLASDFQARGPVAEGSQDLYEYNVSRTPHGTPLRLTATYYDPAGNITDSEITLLAVP